ncbi:MAG: hypothetical protein EBR60_06680 [Burkholderiaceae bacterium]|nr:hypothetical protein [Burkholderiaceae bacterium]
MARAPKDEFGTIIADAKPTLQDLEKESSDSLAAVNSAVAEAESAAAAAATAEAEGNAAAIAAGTTPATDLLPPGYNPTVSRTVIAVVSNGDGTSTIIYSDDTRTIIGEKTDTTTTKPTTNIDILKAGLRGLGFSTGVIDASTGFLNSLLSEGLDYDNATDVFLNNKDYTLKNGTKINSPFYSEYGYLNEVLASPKPPSELYNAVEGYKIVQQKFNLDKKFTTPDYLKDLVKNNVDVETFSQRANLARLAAINSDPAKVQALIKLGNIQDATGLTDFYLDPKIGQEVMQQNLNTAAFVTEAVRRSQSGIAVDTAYAKQVGADLTAKGFSQEQVTSVAAQGYEKIGQQLNPLVKLEQIYGQKTGMGSAPESQLRADLQKQLEAEQFNGTASELLRKRIEQEQLAFQRRSGTIGAGRLTGGSFAGKNNVGAL